MVWAIGAGVKKNSLLSIVAEGMGHAMMIIGLNP
jgi:hypothetical protein